MAQIKWNSYVLLRPPGITQLPLEGPVPHFGNHIISGTFKWHKCVNASHYFSHTGPSVTHFPSWPLPVLGCLGVHAPSPPLWAVLCRYMCYVVNVSHVQTLLRRQSLPQQTAVLWSQVGWLCTVSALTTAEHSTDCCLCAVVYRVVFHQQTNTNCHFYGPKGQHCDLSTETRSWFKHCCK